MISKTFGCIFGQLNIRNISNWRSGNMAHKGNLHPITRKSDKTFPRQNRWIIGSRDKRKEKYQRKIYNSSITASRCTLRKIYQEQPFWRLKQHSFCRTNIEVLRCVLEITITTSTTINIWAKIVRRWLFISRKIAMKSSR